MVINDIPSSFGDSVDVKVEYVPWTNKDVAENPETVSLTTYSNSEGTITVPVEITDPLYGYRVYISPVGQTVANESGRETYPGEFELSQNYPYPFNPSTVISYQVPINSNVRLKVYDMLGREVSTLVDGQVAAGTHQVQFDASELSSGVYIYQLQVGSEILTKKMMLIK